MPRTPEGETRDNIDRRLTASGWTIQCRDDMSIHAVLGVTIREFPLKSGFVGDLHYWRMPLPFAYELTGGAKGYVPRGTGKHMYSSNSAEAP